VRLVALLAGEGRWSLGRSVVPIPESLLIDVGDGPVGVSRVMRVRRKKDRKEKSKGVQREKGGSVRKAMMQNSPFAEICHIERPTVPKDNCGDRKKTEIQGKSGQEMDKYSRRSNREAPYPLAILQAQFESKSWCVCLVPATPLSRSGPKMLLADLEVARGKVAASSPGQQPYTHVRSISLGASRTAELARPRKRGKADLSRDIQGTQDGVWLAAVCMVVIPRRGPRRVVAGSRDGGYQDG